MPNPRNRQSPAGDHSRGHLGPTEARRAGVSTAHRGHLFDVTLGSTRSGNDTIEGGRSERWSNSARPPRINAWSLDQRFGASCINHPDPEQGIRAA
jgi:hypothetical protein